MKDIRTPGSIKKTSGRFFCSGQTTSTSYFLANLDNIITYVPKAVIY